MITINAAAAIYAANLCDDLQQGVEMAQDAIGGGMALEKLNDLVGLTQAMSTE